MVYRFPIQVARRIKRPFLQELIQPSDGALEQTALFRRVRSAFPSFGIAQNGKAHFTGATLRLIACVPEGEYKPGCISEIALVRVRRERIGKTGQEIVNLRRPERNVMSQRNIDATAKYHSERLRSGSGLERAPTDDRLANLLESVAVHVAVGRTEQEMPKRVYAVRTNLDLWAKGICKQVTGDRPRGAPRKNWTLGKEELVRVALVSLQIGLDAKVFVNIDDKRATTPIEAMALGKGRTRCKTRKRVIHPQFVSREFLCCRAQG